MKEIKIETIDDIIKKVPFDRIDYFLKDLKSYIEFKINMYKELEKIEVPEGFIESSMIWIDDGKNDFKGINIEIK